jgi:glycine/D-amino acid oxidase-like deaminating enzyme
MPDSPDRCDVAIIGAGPVGLFAVFECGMLQMRCAVFDALPEPGGQCAALYPEKPIYDIPGYPRIDAAELVDRLAEQAAPFTPVFHLGHAVTRLEPANDGFVIENAGGVQVGARAVIIAAGAGAFGPNRPPLPGIETFEAQRVLSRPAPRGFPRPPGRDRRRRRFSRRLGLVAGRGRQTGSRSSIAGPGFAPRRNRRPGFSNSPIRAGSTSSPPISSTLWRAPMASCPPSSWRIWPATCVGSKPIA